MRFADLLLILRGSSSGEQIIKAAAAASGAITLPSGTTDFSGTGGTSQVVKQTTAGGAFTVGQVAVAEVSGAAPIASPSFTGTVTTAGNLTANGQIYSLGGSAGFTFEDRSNPGTTYLWYNNSGTARLWNGTDRLTVGATGNMTINGSDNPLGIIASSGNNARTTYTVTGGRQWMAGVRSDGLFIISDVTAGIDRFWLDTTGGVNLSNTAALIVGAPTGGNKGGGTINATAVYANNVLLTSDARLKRDIAPLPERCLDLVAAIEPKQFKFIEPPLPAGPAGWFDRVRWGFVAQDVETAMQAHDFGGVEVGEDGMRSLSVGDLVAVLWKAVREQTVRIAALEATLDARDAPTG